MGKYTNEPLLLGIANHLRMEGGGPGAAGGDINGAGGSLDLLSVNGLSQIIQWEGWTGGSIETALTKPAVAKQIGLFISLFLYRIFCSNGLSFIVIFLISSCSL